MTDAPLRRPRLSATIITLNASRHLPACLDSLVFCDEVVVVDSGSTDDTVEIARQRGARVIHHDWPGFGRQKQYAVEQASHEWILSLDADERVSDTLQMSIQAALESSDPERPEYHAYRFARCNRFLGRYLRHGEGYPDLNLRLFDRRYARWSEDDVHEKVLPEGGVGDLQGDLLHDSADSLEAYLAKQNRYTSLAAKAAFERGRSAHAGHLLLSPLFRFLKFYLFKCGFLDGMPGLIHILIGCFNSFTKYAKIIELQRDQTLR